jgi:hypothetical protein
VAERLGFSWPLVVAALAAACCYAIQPEWHQFGDVALLVVILGLFGAPAVGVCLHRWLPQKWPEALPGAAALLLTVVVAGLRAYAALGVFVWATLPLGWIE